MRFKAFLAALALVLIGKEAQAALAVAQFASNSAASSVPGSVTFAAAPTTGDLVIDIVHESTVTTLTLNTAGGWVQIGNCIATDNSSVSGYILARYAQNGDTATPPAAATAGTVKWAIAAYDISGVSGNIDADVQTVSCVGVQASGANPLTFPTQTPQTANTLVIGSESNPFTTTPPTSPAGWTVDINSGTVPNWDTLAAFHKLNAATGTPLTFLNGYGAGDVMQITLQATAPTYPYVHTSYSNSFDSSSGALNTAVLLHKAPKVGNLVVGCASFPAVSVGLPTVSGSWTQFADSNDGTNDHIKCMYRYAVGGDTASLPGFFTSASAFAGWGYEATEIAGTTGVWAKDFQSQKVGTGSGTSFTTTSDTTLQKNTLVLVESGIGAATSTTAPTPGSGYAFDTGAGGKAGAQQISTSKTFASKSSSVSETVTFPVSTTVLYWMQALFGAAPASGGFFHAVP